MQCALPARAAHTLGGAGHGLGGGAGEGARRPPSRGAEGGAAAEAAAAAVAAQAAVVLRRVRVCTSAWREWRALARVPRLHPPLLATLLNPDDRASAQHAQQQRAPSVHAEAAAA